MSDSIVSLSPADPSDEIGRFPVASDSDVEGAIARARAAFPAWRDAGNEARARILRAFRDITRERAAELAPLIAREVGKALWEAKGEASLVPAKVDVSLDAGMKWIADIDVGGGARATYHPRGVLAVLGPFNFPAHLPNGHIVPALAAGNTVVFKPSDKAPAVGAWMRDRWREAGLPDGVLEVVQGGGKTGESLACHPDVDGVLFTGSYAVGRALSEATLDQPHKILALEMGGKNAMVVLEDADLDLAVAEAAFSIAATTGQRCTCASRLFVAAPRMDAFTDKLVAVLRGLRIGMPLDEGVFMGPLVSEAAYESVVRMRGFAREAGGERILEVDPELPPPFIGPGLVRFRELQQSHAYQREEMFGPEAALYPIDDVDHAIAAVNDSEYGLAAAIMTRDRAAYDRCVGRIRTGILNWNKGTVGASGKLPFGGGGRSGNDRPAGVSASIYCTQPQSHLESEAGFDPSLLPPGMPTP